MVRHMWKFLCATSLKKVIMSDITKKETTNLKHCSKKGVFFTLLQPHPDSSIFNNSALPLVKLHLKCNKRKHSENENFKLCLLHAIKFI